MFLLISTNDNSEKGVAMLELAITLPVLLLLIALIFTSGIAYREVGVAVDAVRYATRVGDTKSWDYPDYCNSGDVSTPQSCTAAIANAANSLQEEVVAAACNYVVASGGGSNDWNVTSVSTALTEGGLTVNSINATLSRADGLCFFCIGGAVTFLFGSAESSFIAEGPCT